MLIKRAPAIRPSEITPERVFRARRRFLAQAGLAGLMLAPGGLLRAADVPPEGEFARVAKSRYSTDEPLTPYDAVTTYNNFYEFGTGKTDPAEHAGSLRTRPWSVAVEGECARPAVYDLEDFVKPYAPEERIYRMRCVEAWSMVIPWIGFPLARVIERAQPTSRAKYVELLTLYDPEQMPGQRGLLGAGLDWPYVEGLRLDEAMHPLTILAVGLYGKVLPNQNGAPLRLVVPWKYGFKSIKSIVRIRFVERMPATTWMKANPFEYGFYSNVNPTVHHPRWSQKYETRIGEDSLLDRLLNRRPTLMFNGYADEVAHLYQGMDLRKWF